MLQGLSGFLPSVVAAIQSPGDANRFSTGAFFVVLAVLMTGSAFAFACLVRAQPPEPRVVTVEPSVAYEAIDSPISTCNTGNGGSTEDTHAPGSPHRTPPCSPSRSPGARSSPTRPSAPRPSPSRTSPLKHHAEVGGVVGPVRSPGFELEALLDDGDDVDGYSPRDDADRADNDEAGATSLTRRRRRRRRRLCHQWCGWMGWLTRFSHPVQVQFAVLAVLSLVQNGIITSIATYVLLPFNDGNRVLLWAGVLGTSTESLCAAVPSMYV
jgi:hypothetical protein